MVSLKNKNNKFCGFFEKQKLNVTYSTFLQCGLAISYEGSCDWTKPSVFLQMVNVCIDDMAFDVAHELEEGTLEDVSVREPENKNLEADDHTHTHFFLTHQVEPYIQGIS